MGSFIQLNDIDGTARFVNIRYIVCIEPHNENCKVILSIPGRGEYTNFAFLTTQTYDTVMRLIIDSNV